VRNGTVCSFTISNNLTKYPQQQNRYTKSTFYLSIAHDMSADRFSWWTETSDCRGMAWQKLPQSFINNSVGEWRHRLDSVVFCCCWCFVQLFWYSKRTNCWHSSLIMVIVIR